MRTATTIDNISTSSRIKALGLPANDTRKALHILALSEALIEWVFAKPAPKAEAKAPLAIKAVPKTQ